MEHPLGLGEAPEPPETIYRQLKSPLKPENRETHRLGTTSDDSARAVGSKLKQQAARVSEYQILSGMDLTFSSERELS
jgi:hypothetical protein